MATTAKLTARAEMARDDYRRDLGDGLVLRWTTPDDVERVVALYQHVFRRGPDKPPNRFMPFWTRDMFSGRHPHIGPRDFAIVEDTRSGVVVACTCLLGYACRYEGIPFTFGRPEVVATLPDFRRRGLIRAIFELIHAKSDERGDLAQGITGIPYYYRQFGYEYAAPLEEEATVFFPAIPALKPDSSEPYALVESTPEDAPLLERLWQRTHARADAALWSEIGEDYWRWAMAGMHAEALERWRVYLIAEATSNSNTDGRAAGRRVGALVLFPGRWDASVRVFGPLVEDGTPLVKIVPSVLRALRELAPTTMAMRADTPPAGAIVFRMGGPSLRQALGSIPYVEPAHPYPWYLRVADVPRFVRHVAPVLEQRLAASAHAGYSGELSLDFYRGGLRLVFERGKLATAEDWQRPVWGESMAGYPPLVFLQALFGYRNLEELRGIYPDVWAEGDAVALLQTLFPKRPSLLLPLD